MSEKSYKLLRGEWVHPEGAQSETRACTLCDSRVTMDFDTTTWEPTYKYCPYCGADMRGSEER